MNTVLRNRLTAKFIVYYLICYDLRFHQLLLTEAFQGLNLKHIVSQI